jgi:hypothetical protein
VAEVMQRPPAGDLVEQRLSTLHVRKEAPPALARHSRWRWPRYREVGEVPWYQRWQKGLLGIRDQHAPQAAMDHDWAADRAANAKLTMMSTSVGNTPMVSSPQVVVAALAYPSGCSSRCLRSLPEVGWPSLRNRTKSRLDANSASRVGGNG